MITINKIKKKYVLTLLLTFIFAFSSLPLDVLSYTGISPSDSTIAFAKSKSSGKSSFTSKSNTSSSKSKSGYCTFRYNDAINEWVWINSKYKENK